MSKITIGIEESLWRELLQLKLDLKIRTFDGVINYLLKNREPSQVLLPCHKLKPVHNKKVNSK